MVDQYLPFAAPAALVSGDNAIYVLGTEWDCAVDGSWLGVRWYPPDDLVGGFNYYIIAYAVTGGVFIQSRLIAPASGSAQTFLFTAPIAVTAGTRYVACVLLKHYAYTSAAQGWVWPFDDGAGLTGRTARLVETVPDDERFPSGTTTLNFHISPVLAGTDGAIITLAGSAGAVSGATSGAPLLVGAMVASAVASSATAGALTAIARLSGVVGALANALFTTVATRGAGPRRVTITRKPTSATITRKSRRVSETSIRREV